MKTTEFLIIEVAENGLVKPNIPKIVSFPTEEVGRPYFAREVVRNHAPCDGKFIVVPLNPVSNNIYDRTTETLVGFFDVFKAENGN